MIPLKYKFFLFFSLIFAISPFLFYGIPWLDSLLQIKSIDQRYFEKFGYWISFFCILFGYVFVTVFKFEFPTDKSVWSFRAVYILGYLGFWKPVTLTCCFFLGIGLAGQNSF